MTNVKKSMDGTVIGADTPDQGPIGTNNPATVTSGNRLDQPATPLGGNSQAPVRPMARNLRSPVQPPAAAVETPGKSNVAAGPPAPLRGAMTGYQDSASPSMAPRTTDSPVWDKKPATPTALINPSGGQIPGILAPDLQSGDVKINRLTGKPFGWRPGDADPSAAALAASKKPDATIAMPGKSALVAGPPASAANSAPAVASTPPPKVPLPVIDTPALPAGNRTPAQALEALKNGAPVPPTIAAAPPPAVAAPSPAAIPPTLTPVASTVPTPTHAMGGVSPAPPPATSNPPIRAAAPTPLPASIANDVPDVPTQATGIRASIPTPAQAMKPNPVNEGKPFDAGPYPTLPKAPAAAPEASMSTADQSKGVAAKIATEEDDNNQRRAKGQGWRDRMNAKADDEDSSVPTFLRNTWAGSALKRLQKPIL